MKLVVLLSFACLAAAAPLWDDSVEHRYVDKHGRVVEVEYKGVPMFGKVPTAGPGSAVAAVRAAASVGGLPNQPQMRYFLDFDDDDYVVRSGGKFRHIGGAPLLKAAGPGGENYYVDGSGEVLYTLDAKNNLVPLRGDHPVFKSAAPGENPFLLKQSVETFGGASFEVVFPPHAKPQGVARAPGQAAGDGVVIAKK